MDNPRKRSRSRSPPPWRSEQNQRPRGDGGGVDPWRALFHGEVVDQVAGFEVVSGVEDEVCGAEEVVDVGGRGRRGFSGSGFV